MSDHVYDHAASFGQHARAYARHRPTYPDALFDWLTGLAPSRHLAVDVATGAGQAASALAARFERVVATDRSAELLATIPPHPRLTTIAQPAEELDIGERADLVVTAQALHWFAGAPFWERVAATSRPGGVFAAFGYAPFTVAPDIDAVLGHPALEPHWSPRNRLLRERGEDVLGALAPRLAEVWPDDATLTIEMPLAVRAFHVG